MGIIRTLYREIRDILGLKPPPENETQRAERVAGELKGQFMGKRTRDGDDYVLATAVDARAVTIRCEALTSRAILTMTTSFRADFDFAVTQDPPEEGTEASRGMVRASVGSGIYLEGVGQDDLNRLQQLWKELPTGARGVISQLLSRTYGTVSYEDGAVTYTPGAPTLEDRSAKSTIRTQLQQLGKIVEGVETGWR